MADGVVGGHQADNLDISTLYSADCDRGGVAELHARRVLLGNQ